MYNPKPEKLIELRLLVDAGSINEDDDQLGWRTSPSTCVSMAPKTFPALRW
jgi:hypothetical protein